MMDNYGYLGAGVTFLIVVVLSFTNIFRGSQLVAFTQIIGTMMGFALLAMGQIIETSVSVKNEEEDEYYD